MKDHYAPRLDGSTVELLAPSRCFMEPTGRSGAVVSLYRSPPECSRTVASFHGSPAKRSGTVAGFHRAFWTP
jgi:hypothetical protein